MTFHPRQGTRCVIIAVILAVAACDGGAPTSPDIKPVSRGGKATPKPSSSPKASTSPRTGSTPSPAVSVSPSPSASVSPSPSVSPSASASPSASPSVSPSPSPSPSASVSPSPSPSPSASTPAGDVVTSFVGGAGADDADFVNSTTPASARFNAPAAIAVDSAGNFYVADTDNRRVRKITPAGAVTTAAGTGDALILSAPRGVAVSATGAIYVSDSGRHVVSKVESDGSLTTVAGEAGSTGTADGTTTARFDSPQGLAFGSDGALYVADTGNHLIRKLVFTTPTAATVSTVAGTTQGDQNGAKATAQFNSPVALCRLGTDLVVVESNAHRLRRIKISGVNTAADFVSAFAGSTPGLENGPVASAQFSFPSGVASDASGNVYVADTLSMVIRKIAGGQVTTFAGTNSGIPSSRNGGYADAGFGAPSGLVVHNGHLYVTDIDQHNVRKIKLP